MISLRILSQDADFFLHCIAWYQVELALRYASRLKWLYLVPGPLKQDTHMKYTQEQLMDLYLRMGEDTPELGIYPRIGASSVDDVVLQGITRKAPDGTEQLELAIGVIMYDCTAVAFPLIDVLKFAMQQHPELLERAQAELQAQAAV